mgnify:CR=1 FL=1
MAKVDRDAAVEDVRSLARVFQSVINVAEALGLMAGVNVTTTGTGYLRSREDAKALRIHNDLKAWHAFALDLGPLGLDLLTTELERF